MDVVDRNYPQPRVPITPVLSPASFRNGAGGASDMPFILDAGVNVTMVTSGRIALAKALAHCGVCEDTRVLVPSYHCTSLVDPVFWLGAEPIFYDILEDLSVDLADIEAKMAGGPCALIVVHYFGFPQPQMDRITALCRDQGIKLIEDCAHAAFGARDGRALGTFGDFAIASPAKFFPILDGGYLLAREARDEPLRRGGLAFQLKALVNPVEKSVGYGHFSPLNTVLRGLFRIKDLLWRVRKGVVRRRGGDGDTMVSPDSADGGFVFDPKWIDIRMSAGSRFLVRRLARSRVVDARRRAYEKMLAAFADEPGCHAMMPDLDGEVVPYVFPLYVDNAASVFDTLKREGVPIYRWDSLRSQSCEVSNRFSSHLFQLPCHQELTPSELDWIIERVCQALRRCC